MVFSKVALFAFLQVALTSAKTVNVKVGGNNALTFTPQTVTAAAGDTVRFTFIDQNHTVTSGIPGVGCKPDNKINSNFVPVAAGTAAGNAPTFDVPITNTQPINIYCAQAQHCQANMVMIINPTNAGATSLAAYQRVCSQAQTNTPAKGGVKGGTLRNAQTATAAKAGAAKGGAKAGGAKAAGGAAAKAGAAANAIAAKLGRKKGAVAANRFVFHARNLAGRHAKEN